VDQWSKRRKTKQHAAPGKKTGGERKKIALEQSQWLASKKGSTSAPSDKAQEKTGKKRSGPSAQSSTTKRKKKQKVLKRFLWVHELYPRGK